MWAEGVSGQGDHGSLGFPVVVAQGRGFPWKGRGLSVMLTCEFCGEKVEEGVLVISKKLDISPFFSCNSCFCRAANDSLPEIIERLRERG